MLGDRRPEIVVDHTRLHDGEALQWIDLEDPVHPIQAEDDAPVDGVGAAGQAGAGAARHDRDAVR